MHNASEDKDLLKEYVQVITQLTETVTELIRMEETKTEIASLGQHQRMSGLLKEEQAGILKLRGLEQHRGKLQESLDWSGLTFRQILGRAEEQTALLSPMFTELEQQVKRLQDVRDSAQRIVKLRLREFASALAEEEGYSYNDNGEMEYNIPSHFRDTYV